MKPTITEQQAREKVEQYIRGALGALPGTARRTLFSRNRSECGDPTDHGPCGRYEISATYEITGLDPARYAERFTAIVHWWAAHEFTVLSDARPKGQYVFVRNKVDGFDMSLEANDLGKLYLGATSPCVWPDGTPPGAPARAHRPPSGSVPARDDPAPPPSAERERGQAAKPRRTPRPSVEEDEDFSHIDWTDDTRY
jgi:hypothetical protein